MIIPARQPTEVNFIASYPLPSSSRRWPGKILRAVSCSGAPKNIEGRKSMNA